MNAGILCWPRNPELRQKLSEIAEGKPIPFYADSVEANCSLCGLEVWLGPRQAKLRVADVPIYCAFCLIFLQKEHSEVIIRDLGNLATAPEPK